MRSSTAVRRRRAGPMPTNKTTDERFRWSVADLWAWLDLNQRPHPDPKIHDEQAGGNTRLRCAAPGPSSWVRAVSGGGFEGDLVAEGLQLADVVAPGALSVDAGVVEAGAQVLEPCGRVGQQMPDDDQDGPADRHDGPLGTAAAGDPTVALTKEGIGLAGGDGRLAEHPSQIRVAVPGRPAALAFAGRLLDAGGELGPRHQMPSGREPGHVHAELGDEQAGGDLADPGDLIQPINCPGEAGDQLLELGVELGQVGVQLVHSGQHLGEQKACWSVKNPQNASTSGPSLARNRVRASWARTLGSRSPATSAASMARLVFLFNATATTESLIWASSSSLLDPLLLGGPDRHQIG